ncbi:hypothetical protein K3495_g15053 [Podosphaera aphanis]|nr:hypothetical protein K3495_g15053 [Podosphaera aphanis]
MTDNRSPESVQKISQQTVSMGDFLKLKRQFEELISRQASTSQVTSSRVIIEKDPPPKSGQNFKPTKLREFHGNRIRYPAWRAAVLDTFRMDCNFFRYDNSRAFLMIYNSMRGGALEKAGPFFEAGGVNQTRDPADFLEFLDHVYLDTTRVSQANIELQNLKMKENERLADFFASWSNKLTEARGDFWADENKISMLENATSKRLMQALAGNHLLPDNDFGQWVQIVSKIAMRVERADRKLGWPPGPSNRGLAKSNYILKEGLSESVPRATSNYQQDFREPIKPVIRAEQAAEVDAAGDTIMGGICYRPGA